MDKAKTFQDLLVWQKAHSFVLGVYPYARSFPKDETYALGSQFRRAAVSIAANIAEGFRKRSDKDKLKSHKVLLRNAGTTSYSPTTWGMERIGN